MAYNSPSFYLYKRPNQIYYIGYYDQGRLRWKSTGHRTKPEAHRALTQFRELLQGAEKSVTLREFIDQFLTHSKSVHRPKTLSLFRSTLHQFSRLVGQLWLKEVTPQHIDRYKAKRLREVKPVSVNVELRMLKSAFSTAKRWKLIEANPLDGLSMASVPQQAPVFFKPNDFHRLVECIKEAWFREVVLFAVLTGMRKGELLNLRWSDVDFARRLLNIETSATFKTKQGKRRTIPLNDSALYLLKSREGKSPSEYVFTLNDRPLSGGWVTHLFKPYVRKAGLTDERLHFHSLRHTFASWLVQGGASLYEVQKLLGHSSANVTQIYSHLQPDQMHDTVNRLTVNLN